MKLFKFTYRTVLAATLLMTGCTVKDSLPRAHQEDPDYPPMGSPVLFTVGNLSEETTTKATIPYMAQDGRFVCTMYYHPGKDDTDASDFDIKHPTNDGGTMATAWLQVNNTVGNSVYRQNTFVTPTNVDTYGFDMDATNFYWQNRLTHAFLALADYNKLSTNDGSTTDQGKLKMYPDYDKDTVPDPGTEGTDAEIAAYQNTLSANRYVNTYDMTKGTKTSMSKQPDPILALTLMKPAGATQEANRVRLYFKHQFSQIQVNLKGADDNSANITASQIDKVELLGVSEEAYVPCRLNADGTVGNASYKSVNKDIYTDTQLDENPYGTSFSMFAMTTAVENYLKSFNAIAFGELMAIRITWHETAEESGSGTDPTIGIEHVSTYKVPLNSGEASGYIPMQQLQSGRKYIYNFELRRGTLAVIRTQIVDWKQDENMVYGTDGTITN